MNEGKAKKRMAMPRIEPRALMLGTIERGLYGASYFSINRGNSRHVVSPVSTYFRLKAWFL